MAIILKNQRMVKRKPAYSAKQLIWTLAKGKGYTLEELHELWGTSLRSIQTYSRELDCSRWVETDEEGWTEMVMHPDTAKQLDRKHLGHDQEVDVEEESEFMTLPTIHENARQAALQRNPNRSKALLSERAAERKAAKKKVAKKKTVKKKSPAKKVSRARKVSRR